MKSRSPKQFDLLANCFERIRDHDVMIESSWCNSKPLAYFTNSKTSCVQPGPANGILKAW